MYLNIKLIFLSIVIFTICIIFSNKYNLQINLNHFQNQNDTNNIIIGNISWKGSTLQDLYDEYRNIFIIAGNRNAASHLWASFLLNRSVSMDNILFEKMFTGFCPVSGSIIMEGRGPYSIILPNLYDNNTSSGYVYYCCWPCYCDTKDFIKIDTKTVQTKNNEQKEYKFLVIGNPCVNPQLIPFSKTPELTCSNGRDTSGEITNAFKSDNGGIIIGMLHESSTIRPESNNVENINLMCQERANNNYQSGMGGIFRQVASINPI